MVKMNRNWISTRPDVCSWLTSRTCTGKPTDDAKLWESIVKPKNVGGRSETEDGSKGKSDPKMHCGRFEDG